MSDQRPVTLNTQPCWVVSLNLGVICVFEAGALKLAVEYAKTISGAQVFQGSRLEGVSFWHEKDWVRE